MTVDWDEPVAFDNFGNEHEAGAESVPGSSFPVGNTIAEYAFWDAVQSQEAGTCTFDVIVEPGRLS